MRHRYTLDWTDDQPEDFIGGFERFDLWRDFDNDLRIVWGQTDYHWHFVLRGDPRFALSESIGFGALVDPPTVREMLYIKRYLKMFAPDVWAGLKIGAKP